MQISRQDVETRLDMSTCVDGMRAAFEALAGGVVQAPPRTVIRMADRPGFFGAMPVYASGYGSAAKVMTIYPENHDSGMESHQGYILLFAEEHGEPLALIEAGSITEIRTAAVSALATDLLANTDASKLCVLGSGVQARSHVRAISCVRNLKEIQIWSRTSDHAHRFGEWARQETGLDIALRDDVEHALEGADIVCTVTAASEPIVEGDWMEDGCHLNAVGSFTPSARELDSATVKRSRLFVDSRDSALKESGDVLIPIEEGTLPADHIVGDLAELVTGSVTGRRHKDEVTVFKSLGLAVEDLVAAKIVYDALSADRCPK